VTLLSPFKDRNFLRLYLAQIVSLLGTGLATIALALIVFDQYPEQAGLILGAVLAVKMVAYLFVAPLVGAYVHRLSRRKWLAALNLCRAVIIAALPWFYELWHLFALVFLLNVMAAGYTPVYQALLPDILQDAEQYTQALALSRLAMELESLLSPTLAAALLLVLPYSILFELNAVAFVLAVLLLLTSRFPAPSLKERSGGIWQHVSFGIKSYLGTPRLKAVLWLNLAISAAGAMVIVNSVVYVRQHLNLDENYVPLVMASLGCGSMFTALILPRLLSKTSDRSMMRLGGFLASIALFAGLSQPGYLGLFLLWFMVGIASSLVLIPTGRVVSESCKPGDRSDFFSANFSLTHGMWLICYLVAGFVGQTFGLVVCFGVLGLIALVSTLMAGVVWRVEGQSSLWHEHPTQDHLHPHVHDEHHQHAHEGWEGPEPHVHSHHHVQQQHRHHFVIDEHHLHWPRQL